MPIDGSVYCIQVFNNLVNLIAGSWPSGLRVNFLTASCGWGPKFESRQGMQIKWKPYVLLPHIAIRCVGLMQ